MARRQIVVGIDGSSASRHALDWALREANLRGCAVQVVTVVPRTGDGPDDRGDLETARARERAAERQSVLISEALAETPCSRTLTFQVVTGQPHEVLVDLSAEADLIVMGSHGVSGLRHSALGSTSDAVARMAGCPVVVIPARVLAASARPGFPMVRVSDTGTPRLSGTGA